MPVNVLSVGLHWQHPSVKIAGSTPDKVYAHMSKSIEQCAQAGYTLTQFLITEADMQITSSAPSADSTSPYPVLLPLWRAELVSKKWDVIMVGYGVRGPPVHTVMFEMLLQVARELVPQARWAFNDGPGGTLEALRRVMPVS